MNYFENQIQLSLNVCFEEAEKLCFPCCAALVKSYLIDEKKDILKTVQFLREIPLFQHFFTGYTNTDVNLVDFLDFEPKISISNSLETLHFFIDKNKVLQRACFPLKYAGLLNFCVKSEKSKLGNLCLYPKIIYNNKTILFQLRKKGRKSSSIYEILHDWCIHVGFPFLNCSEKSGIFFSSKKDKILKQTLQYYMLKDTITHEQHNQFPRSLFYLKKT